jgi:uncharacterized membrane protein
MSGWNEFAVARALHLLAVLFWIGGVAMVTTVILPATRRVVPERERVDFFEAVESRFAWQSRVTTLLTAGSGFWLVAELDLWSRFADPGFWWMHAMVAVWAVFTLMLFVLEPLVLHRWFQRRGRRDPVRTFAMIQRLHWGLLAVSIVTFLGAAVGAHGGL